LKTKKNLKRGKKFSLRQTEETEHTKIIDKYTKNIDRRTDGQTEASETIDK
jgi:hypothetical protein